MDDAARERGAIGLAIGRGRVGEDTRSEGGTFVRRCRCWRASVKVYAVTRKAVMLPLIIPRKLPPFMRDISPRRGGGGKASP